MEHLCTSLCCNPKIALGNSLMVNWLTLPSRAGGAGLIPGKRFPDGSLGKESTCNAGDPGWILRSGRSAGEEIGYPLQYSWASLVAQLVKNLPAVQETWVQPWVGKIPWRREQLPIPVFWPGEFHRLYSTWGLKESDTTEWLSLSGT